MSMILGPFEFLQIGSTMFKLLKGADRCVDYG